MEIRMSGMAKCVRPKGMSDRFHFGLTKNLSLSDRMSIVLHFFFFFLAFVNFVLCQSDRFSFGLTQFIVCQIKWLTYFCWLSPCLEC